MGQSSDTITALSSTGLRACAYAFLRWIPGHHFPPIIYSLLAVYLASFVRSFITTKPYKILSDEIEVFVKETETGREDVDEDDNGAAQLQPAPIEEVDIEEVTVYEEKGAQPWRTLLLGLPSPTSILLSIATVLTNLALVTMVTDLVYRAPALYPAHDLTFARVGYVSDHSASLLVREPRGSEYPLDLYYRYADDPRSEGLRPDDSWKHEHTVSWAHNDTDFTSAITISGLKPDTRYQYSVANHTGYFITAPKVGQVSWRTDGKYTFLHSSCIKARFPYTPFQHPLHVPGFKHLAKWIPKLRAHFMLLLGDFIYIDVPRRLGTDAETYRREYRQVYASPEWPSVSDDLPWLHVIDDHEIANDWDGNTTGVYQAAVDPWMHYQVAVNPPAVRSGETYFSFTQGPASFFLMDTRRYRSPEFDLKSEDETKTMLGQAQLADLLYWLQQPVPTGVKWKVVVSSIPFTKNWRVNNADTWAGYLAERRKILEAMWEVGSTSGVGVVVLSGDRHEFAATSFPPPSNSRWPISATVHEFSTSPLSMFYLPVRTYEQKDEEDVCIKYIPDGNSKFGAIEITNDATSDQSELKYRLFVEGDEVWSHRILTPPENARGKRNRDAVWA